MKTFKQYIGEEVEEAVTPTKLTHLAHSEDLPLDRGQKGLQQITSIYRNIFNQMLDKSARKSVTISTKWDGSPSLVFGVNPENKKFFVGTKSVFNKATPKLNYTNEDIDINHPVPGLNSKLKAALKYLPELEPKRIFQGDFMFIHSDLEPKTIDGVKYVTFRPNTITYAVPVGSNLEKEISRAQIGIILHTEYSGSTISGLTASHKINTAHFKKSPNVFTRDADFENIEGKTAVTKEDEKFFNSKIRDAEKLGKELRFLNTISDTPVLHDSIAKFNNALIKLGEKSASAEDIVQKLTDYITKTYDVAIAALKTERGKAAKQEEKTETLGLVAKNYAQMVLFYKLQKELIDIKLFIVKKLEQLQQIGTYVNNGTGGYTKTRPEGFVAVSDDGVIKLVDRNEFSRLNFQIAKNWDKSV